MNVSSGPCESASFLPPQVRTELIRTYPSVDRHLIVEDLVCVLGSHGEGEHYAVLYDHFAAPIMGALWTRWRDNELPDSCWIRPDCPSRSPSADACGHFLAHPGAHSWETEERWKDIDGQAVGGGLFNRPPHKQSGNPSHPSGAGTDSHEELRTT